MEKKNGTLVLDLARVAEVLGDALAVIAPDGQLPPDFEDQVRAATERAIARGDLDAGGVTAEGLERIRNQFGCRAH